MTAPTYSSLRAWLCGVLVAVFAAGCLHLGTFEPIGPGLDWSWVAALGEAATRGDIFGRDLVLTSGPLASLYTRYFDPVQWSWVLVAGAFVAISLGLSCARLASGWLTAVLLLAVFLIGSAVPILIANAILIGVPALAALAVLIRPRASYVLVFVAAIATAAVALTKFSVAPVAVVSFAAIDVALLRERRAPLGLAACAAAFAGWFALLEGGSSLAYLADFVRYSLELSAGYSAAMGLAGSGWELAGFIACALILAAIAGLRVYRPSTPEAAGRPLLAAIVLIAFLFVGFKAGFVRHDLHSVIAWDTLALAAAAYSGFAIETAARWPIAGICAAAISIALVLPGANIIRAIATSVGQRAQAIAISAAELSHIAYNRASWVAAQQAAMEQARGAVRAATPLPHLDGSVDALPSMQSAVIAAGLDYRPRFTIQDYADYTRALISKNHDSWFGSRPPDHILFGLLPIDNRYPALSEGPLWPDLMRHYVPGQRFPGFVVLDRRKVALPSLLGGPVTRTVRLGEIFALGDDPSFLSIDVRFTALGLAMNLLFRPPQVDLQLRYADGRQAVYRLIPEIAREGFLVSPRIETAEDFATFISGSAPSLASARPISASIDVNQLGSWAYQQQVTVTTRTVLVPKSNDADLEQGGADRPLHESPP